MLVSLTSLRSVLQNNVCEIKFTRRRLQAGKSPTRRMLCTNSVALLNSVDGRLTLNYYSPGRQPRFNPTQKNLVIAWDIFMQDFRCINCDKCDLITSIPAGEAFWKYFKQNLAPLTPAQKLSYMES